MFKQTCTELLKQPKESIKEWLNSFDTVLTDCDGVLWITTQAIEDSPDVINRFQELGKRVFFVTNNSEKTRAGYLDKAQNMGFKINEDSIISTAYATAKYLEKRKFNKKVYLIGAPGIAQELDNVGIEHTATGPDVIQTNYNDLLKCFKMDPEVGAVIVGLDEHFSFPKLIKAANYLNNPNCIFIATNTDTHFTSKNGIIPDAGSIIQAVESCAERTAIMIGKPNPSICESLLRENGIIPERTLMIGDRCNTDILLGSNCGFQTLLVGTGVHQLDDVYEWKNSGNDNDKKLIPDVYLPKLGDILPYMY